MACLLDVGEEGLLKVDGRAPRLHTSAYVSIPSAYVCTRAHTYICWRGAASL
jgi:hypothetical protein